MSLVGITAVNYTSLGGYARLSKRVLSSSARSLQTVPTGTDHLSTRALRRGGSDPEAPAKKIGKIADADEQTAPQVLPLESAKASLLGATPGTTIRRAPVPPCLVLLLFMDMPSCTHSGLCCVNAVVGLAGVRLSLCCVFSSTGGPESCRTA